MGGSHFDGAYVHGAQFIHNALADDGLYGASRNTGEEPPTTPHGTHVAKVPQKLIERERAQLLRKAHDNYSAPDPVTGNPRSTKMP